MKKSTEWKWTPRLKELEQLHQSCNPKAPEDIILGMPWIVCDRTKNKPRKHIKVCALCSYIKKCKSYQKYLKENKED